MRSLVLFALAYAFLCVPMASANDRDRWGDKDSRFQRQPWGSSYGRWDDRRWDNRRWDDRRDKPAQYGYYGNPFGYNRGPGRYNDDPVRWGISSGRLSRDEVRDLERNASALRRKEERYLADGKLSNWERQDLNDDRRDYFKGLDHNLNDGERRW